jgi:hypothetical protein
MHASARTAVLVLVTACAGRVEASATDATAGSTGAGASEAATAAASTGGEDGVADACAAMFDELDAQGERTCGCEVDAGNYPDVAACISANATEAQRACVCPLWAADPGNAAAATCAAAAERAYTRCSKDVHCDDVVGYQGCVDEYVALYAACPRFASATTAAVEIQCEGAEATSCGSGEQVPTRWVCDGEADCADGSDEAQCAGVRPGR